MKNLQVLVVGGEQHQRAEARRADGVALGDGLGGVADRVERVGGLADLLGQARHLGDAAGIVRDRTEGVERHHHAGHRQHAGHRDGDAEQAGQLEGDDDAGDDDEGRQGGRLQRDGEALDDVGAVAGHGGLADRAHGAVADAGVVLRHHDDGGGHGEADHAAPEQVVAGEGEAARREGGAHAEQVVGERPQRDDRQHAGGDEALVEGAHDRLVGAEPHEEGADDGGHHAERADRQRIEHEARHHLLAGEVDGRQHHGGDHGDGVGLEQVGRHAGAVADVVADVVGDGGGVARVVLGDAGLDLADQVAADVGALGEDAAAETGEDRDQRGAEAERDQRVDHRAAGRCIAEAG